MQGIKRFRNGLCIETLLAHEFEDIHEFIAECYTVSKFVEGNKYADKIRVMIDEIIENNN